MRPDEPDPLDELLAEWQVQAQTPPGFQRDVWRRIAAENPEQTGWVERLAYWLLRPAREVAVVLMAVALAIVWGLTHPPEAEYAPRDAYLMSVSPFAADHQTAALR